VEVGREGGREKGREGGKGRTSKALMHKDILHMGYPFSSSSTVAAAAAAAAAPDILPYNLASVLSSLLRN